MPLSNFKNRPRSQKISMRSGELAFTIPAGYPVVLAMNGTNDGADVVMPSSASLALAASVPQGIAATDILPGQYGPVCVYGFVKECRVIKASRTSTTDGFVSYPAGVRGDTLQIDPVNNGLVRVGAGAAGVNSLRFVLLEAYASSTTAASTTSNSSLVVADTLNVWVALL